MTPFVVHSGAGPRRNRWGVWSPDYFPPWWRLEDKAGRPRTFASREAAQRIADSLTVEAEAHKRAKACAASLREYAAFGERAWRDANRYAGVRASLWGADPFGLYTSDLPRLS